MVYKDYFKEAGADTTIEEKREIIKYNTSQALSLRKQIQAWGGGTLQVNKEATISVSNTICDNNSIQEAEDHEIKQAYDKISLLDISGLSEEELITKIRNLIGDELNSITVNRIKLLLYKECIIYNRMLLGAESEEASELRNMLSILRTKIEVLDELEELEEEQEISDDITSNNNIFFLLSDTGNVIALESLRKNVPRDYYPAFKELILGLKEGKAKGLKKLRKYGYLELKDFKIRVIFDKLSNGNYIILDCFMKKVDTGVSYRNNLANRTRQYQRKIDYYLSNYSKQDFIERHEGYLAEILNLLDSKTLEGNGENEARAI